LAGAGGTGGFHGEVGLDSRENVNSTAFGATDDREVHAKR